MAKLILVANPGSASRKYALFSDHTLKLSLHFENVGTEIICTVISDGKTSVVKTGLDNVENSADQLQFMLRQYGGLEPNEEINQIGLRVVAPSSFFLQDHEFDDAIITILKTLKPRAPLHIAATLNELGILKRDFPSSKIVGVSDSKFHATKPDHAWNYGLPIEIADKYEIKRFGYHGLSVGSVVRSLKKAEKLTPKLIVCHLGSGASVTAVLNGKSIDNTMGYSPLEGLIMSTRSGSIDVTASEVLKDELGLNRHELDAYLNYQSGLLGLSAKSDDIRELLKFESEGDKLSRLALNTYTYNVVKAIGQMSAALNGVDMLVFTGTVGERSASIRKHIVKSLNYLDFIIDSTANLGCSAKDEPVRISKLAKSKPIFVVPAKENEEIVRHILDKV